MCKELDLSNHTLANEYQKELKGIAQVSTGNL